MKEIEENEANRIGDRSLGTVFLIFSLDEILSVVLIIIDTILDRAISLISRYNKRIEMQPVSEKSK